MASEVLKTFKKDVDVEISNTDPLQSQEFILLSTDSTSQAVVKNISVIINDNESEVPNSYNFPCKIELENIPIISENDLAKTDLKYGLFIEGQQIIDKNSSLKLTLKNEPPLIAVPKIDIFVLGNNISMRRKNDNLSEFIGIDVDNKLNNSTILSNMISEKHVSVTKLATYDGTIIYINGSKHYAFLSYNEQKVYYYNDQYEYVGNFLFQYDIGSSMAYDGTYLYGKSDSDYRTICKIKVSDGSFEMSSLQTSVNVGTNIATNDGFIVYYDGFLYLRSITQYNSFYKINTSTGQTSAVTLTNVLWSTYNGGARVNVNIHNKPFIIVSNNENVAVFDIEGNKWIDVPIGGDWSALSTTTYANQVVGVSAGIVAIYSGQHSKYIFVDTNNIDTTSTTTMETTLEISSVYTNSMLINPSEMDERTAFACNDYSNNYSNAQREGKISILVDGIDIQGV